MKGKSSKLRSLKRFGTVLLALAFATALSLPTSLAFGDDVKWPAPQAPKATTNAAGQKYITSAATRQSESYADMLGISNVTWAMGAVASIDLSGSDAEVLARLEDSARAGIFGTDINENPNPWVSNFIYNYWAGANGQEDQKITDWHNVIQIYPTRNDSSGPNSADTKVIDEYGTSRALAMRSDILLGYAGGGGVANGYTDMVAQINSWTSEDPHYEAGDENYSPEYVNVGISSIHGKAQTMYALAEAVQNIQAKDPNKVTRYGDPMEIATKIETYMLGSQDYILSQIAAGNAERKTIGFVRAVDTDTNTVTFLPSNASNKGTPYVAPETLVNVVDNVGDGKFEDSDTYGTAYVGGAEDVMKCDAIVICTDNTDGGAGDGTAAAEWTQRLRQVLAAAGYEENLPDIFTQVPSTVLGIGRSAADNMQNYGIYLGFLYPELLNPVHMQAYFYENFFHVTSNNLAKAMGNNMSTMSLPTGVSLSDISTYSADALEAKFAEGLQFYANNKEYLDALNPTITGLTPVTDANGNYYIDVPAASVEPPIKTDGTRYHIVSKADEDFVLDVEYATPVEGSNVSIWTDNGGGNQVFTFEKNEKGGYILRNAANTELVLDAAGATPAKGANVSTWTANGGNNQAWYLGAGVGDYYYIASVANPSLVLDAAGAEPEVGANVGLWNGNGGPNQLWKFVEAKDLSDATVTATGMTRNIINGTAPKPEIEVALYGKTLVEGEDYELFYGASTEAPTAPGTCTVTAKAKEGGRYTGEAEVGTFSLYDVGDAVVAGLDYRIASKADSGFILDVEYATPVEGSNVSIWTNNGGLNQVFTIGVSEDGYYVLNNVANPLLVLDAAGAEPEQGANVSTWTANGGPNQKWVVVPDGDSGYYSIASAADPSLVLDAAGAEPSIGANVGLWESNGGNNQLWRFVRDTDLEYADVAVSGMSRNATGSALAPEIIVTLSGVELAEGEDYVVRYNGSAEAPSAPGSYGVTVEGAGIYKGSCEVGTFEIHEAPVAAGSGTAYHLVSAFSDEFVLDVEYATPVLGSNVSIWTDNGGDNQLFTLELQADGYYVLRNVANTELVLDAAGAEPDLGANVSTWSFNEGPNQKWVLVPNGDYYMVQSAANPEFVLDAAGAEPSIGANVSVWTANGGPNQLWKLATNEPAVVTYAVTFAAGEGATGEVPTMGAQPEGTRLYLPAPAGLTAPAGKVFAGWVASTDGQTYEAENTKERFQYLMTDEPVTFTAKWVDYFKVTVVDTDGKVLAEKSYTPATFAALKSDSADPQSRLYFKPDVWNVATAATYVTLDDLLADATGKDDYALAKLADGATIKYGTEGFPFTFTAADLRASDKFYPAATPTGTDTAGATTVTPCFSLTGNVAVVTTTAADAQAAAAADADGTAAPRFICGVTEAEYLGTSAAGQPSVTGCTFLTVTVPAA